MLFLFPTSTALFIAFLSHDMVMPLSFPIMEENKSPWGCQIFCGYRRCLLCYFYVRREKWIWCTILLSLMVVGLFEGGLGGWRRERSEERTEENFWSSRGVNAWITGYWSREEYGVVSVELIRYLSAFNGVTNSIQPVHFWLLLVEQLHNYHISKLQK